MTSTSSHSGSEQHKPRQPWKDRTVQFDCPSAKLQIDLGEEIIDSLANIEDTKGNNGVQGRLIVTNLRLIWQSVPKPNVNLSIGFGTISKLYVKMVNSKLHGGNTKALVMSCKSKSSAFSFIFTHLVPSSPRLFNTVQMVLRAYDSTRAYRDIRVRSSNLISDDALLVLPHEEVYEKHDGVWNLSGDKGELGVLLLTNVRVVWFSAMDSRFNASLPYNMIQSFSAKRSKFGRALVVKTMPSPQPLTIGFRVDPFERLESVLGKLTRLFNIYHASPIYGVDFDPVEHNEEEAMEALQFEDDDIEITQNNDVDILAAYAEGKIRGGDTMGNEADGKDTPVEPVFDPYLGLAVEPLREGFTLESLMQIK